MTDEVKRTFDLTDADYERAIGILVLHQKASTSFLQRTMRLGYNAAASLMERAEGDGFVSRAANTGKRDVLISLQEIARLRAELANAGAVMVEACSTCGGSGLRLNDAGDPDECRSCHGDTVVTLSPIAAAARVLLAAGPHGPLAPLYDAVRQYTGALPGSDEEGEIIDGIDEGLRALAEQEKAE